MLSLFIKSTCDLIVYLMSNYIPREMKVQSEHTRQKLFSIKTPFLFRVLVFVCLVLGWKLNPVVSAVYSPEFYAGRRTCPSPCVTISFMSIFLLLICFVLQFLRHLNFLPPQHPTPLILTFITSLFPFFFRATCNWAKSVFSPRSMLSRTNATTNCHLCYKTSTFCKPLKQSSVQAFLPFTSPES